MKYSPISAVYNRLRLENEPPAPPCGLEFKGYMTYAYSFADGLMNRTEDHPLHREAWGDLMTGKEFFTYVDNGSITDYDGQLAAVFVNGYKSNLGLVHKDFCQKGFLIDGESWLDICENNEVLIEWCNK